MPWQLDGTFLRINPDFSGDNVWQQDQQGGIKVIASRHDIHDEDLAGGIENCLNLDGYNAMREDLDFGGFRGVNIAPGVGGTDVINVDQLDAVEAKVDQNIIDIAAINTSDPEAIIQSVSWDGLDMTFVRGQGNWTVPVRLLDDIKAGQKIKHFGQDLTAAAVTDVDTETGNRFYMYNNITGTMDINILRPVGADADLGENYFVEGMIIIENGGTPALPTLQADGVDVNPSYIIGSPTVNAGTRYMLTYSIQRTLGDVYREAYVWSAP